MSYKTHPGIVRVQICGADFLVATRPLQEELPGVKKIPKLWAACWAVMEEGRTDREVVEAFAGLLQKPEEQIREKLEPVFSKLEEQGYLLRE